MIIEIITDIHSCLYILDTIDKILHLIHSTMLWVDRFYYPHFIERGTKV